MCTTARLQKGNQVTLVSEKARREIYVPPDDKELPFPNCSVYRDTQEAWNSVLTLVSPSLSTCIVSERLVKCQETRIHVNLEFYIQWKYTSGTKVNKDILRWKKTKRICHQQTYPNRSPLSRKKMTRGGAVEYQKKERTWKEKIWLILWTSFSSWVF